MAGEPYSPGMSQPRQTEASSPDLPGQASSWIADVDAHLVAMLDRRALPGDLDAAVRYALLGGGKRLRPLLAMASAQAVGANPASALPAAASVELVHAFSLVHDDLPAIDNDDLRRGRPTLHRHAGEAMAILAGDALLSLAFEAAAPPQIPDPLAANLTRELATATTAMIAGQVLDSFGDRAPANHASREARLLRIHEGKTAALFIAACRMGAMCGLSTSPHRDADDFLVAITAFARDIGLMFQVVDDLLDVEQPTDKVGKQTGKDAKAGKLTFPGLWGIERSRAEVERLAASSVQAVAKLGAQGDSLRAIAIFLASRTA